MDIKYGRDGQPLPLEQQSAAAQAPLGQQASSVSGNTGAGAQEGIKSFQVRETHIEGAPVDPHQHDNPFVAQYLRESAQPPIESAPEPEQPLAIAESLENLAPEPEPVKREDSPNFKALRAQAERAERERDEVMRLLRERDARDQQLRVPESAGDDELGLGEDGYVEPKHLKKIYKEVQQLRNEAKQYKQQSAKQIAEAQLRLRYPDIDTVVSPENIQILNETKPGYANILRNMADDIYAQGDMAYQYMIDLGIHKTKSIVPEKDYAADKMRAHNNAAKPRPLVSGTAKSESPLAKANAFAGQLNDNDMKKHYQEMLASIERRD